MFEEDFQKRLNELRQQKGVSARDMSLSIGQNPGYINNIESGKALPSMSAFFFICDYLNITPKDFFDTESIDSNQISLVNSLKKLSPEEISHLALIVNDIIKK